MTRARGGWALGALAALSSLLVTCAIHAAHARTHRRADRPVILAVARRLPGPDLALASGSRHLRFLSLEEPGAAFADMPAGADTDPAGGAIAPPTDVWVRAARREIPGGR